MSKKWTTRDGQITLYRGDNLDVMAGLPADSVDAIVTDPPYGIRFMGKAWDGADIERAAKSLGERKYPKGSRPRGGTSGYSTRASRAGSYDFTLNGNAAFQVWCTEWAAACLRVIKPGGHMLVSGSPRTHHRLMCGIEDAGWQIRDTLGWIFGSGFPKSLDVSKAIDKAAGEEREVLGKYDSFRSAKHADTKYSGNLHTNGNITAPATEAAKQWNGWGTALKPAWEPIILARKPLDGTVANNVQTHGVGGLNIDGCRVATGDGPKGVWGAKQNTQCGNGGTMRNGWSGKPSQENANGRWPANLILTYPEDEYRLRDDVSESDKRRLTKWLQKNA